MKNKELSSAKRELLNKWLSGQLVEDKVSIPTRPQDMPMSLSYPQQRQIFLELLEPGTAVNNLSVSYKLTGKLNQDILEESANRIIARHEILRSHFDIGLGLPRPKIVSKLKATIEKVSLKNNGLGEQLSEARKLGEEAALQPFDLSNAPLLRLNLFELSEETYVFQVVIHHTIADGWSLGIFLNELVSNYNGILNNRSTQLPNLPVQYSDFAHWQNHKMADEKYSSEIAFWKNQLKGELPILDLPTDSPRSVRQSFDGSTHRFSIPVKLTQELERITQGENVTLFMSLFSVFVILLHRYSGQEDIIVGTPIANRNLSEVENLIGIFINTIALRTDLSGDPVFRDLIKNIRDVALNAYAHQDLSFEKLVEELKPVRDLSRPPIFQVVFNMQNTPLPIFNLPGLDIEPLEIDRGVAQFDLSLIITKSEKSYLGTVEYNRHHFEAESIERMFRSYLLILEDIVSKPDLPISQLKLVTENEYELIVHKLNQTESHFPREKFVHHLFEEQVNLSPSSTAIISEAESLTYKELNEKANIMAAHLRSLGVEREVRVGVFMSRSLEIMEALLAILKAGGTYIPINSSYPEDRVRYILEDANVKVLITNIDLSTWAKLEVQTVDLNLKNAHISKTISYTDQEIQSSDLAYIIYTSGSTGQPKGVMVPHSALTNFLYSMKVEPGLSSEDKLMAVTSFSFDIAALELFLPLIVGGTVVLASDEMTTNPYLLNEEISRHQISVMQATPATWQLLIDSDWQGLSSMKALSGGDVLTQQLANNILQRVSSLWNMYGPTETTIWSSICKVEPDELRITIGKPINNTQMYILDKNNVPVPRGVIGELHIGGDGLARGYLNNTKLTSEKFIDDHFRLESGARLYKTGDHARYLQDYSIEVLGRIDHQVKVNGHRIELGEISTLIIQNPLVNEAIVIARTEKYGEKRLVAYFVPKGNTVISDNELRKFLKRKLPSYMIPAVFISLKSLPLTPNGKLDRSALPVPTDTLSTLNYEAPRSADERILTNIWQDVLAIEQVGIHDNFFELGGASIQSLQIVAKANMAGFRMTPESIFEFQTITELVENLKNINVTDKK